MNYADQIHYLDRKAQLYAQIDNSLIKAENGLRNKANGDLTVDLREAQVSISHPDGYRLCWWFEKAEPRKPEFIEIPRDEKTEQEAVAYMFPDPGTGIPLTDEEKKLIERYKRDAADDE